MISSAELVQAIEWLKRMGIENWSFDEDGLVNVNGDVDLSNNQLTEIPVKFGKVDGTFWCSHNRLTSLEGAPSKVGGWFDCSNNEKQFTKEEVRLVVG